MLPCFAGISNTSVFFFINLGIFATLVSCLWCHLCMSPVTFVYMTLIIQMLAFFFLNSFFETGLLCSPDCSESY